MTTYNNAMRAASYGVQETNPLGDQGHNWANFEEETYTLRMLQDAGGRISRFRFLTDPGYPYMDISYIQGILPNGRNVRIQLQSSVTIRKGKGSVPFLRDLIEMAKEEGVYGKKIGMLDEGTWSILK